MKITQEQLEVIRQALAELYHCVEAGPSWFTKGRQGQMAQAILHINKAQEVIKTIEESDK